MFGRESTRTQVACLVLAILIPLAGCSSATVEDNAEKVERVELTPETQSPSTRIPTTATPEEQSLSKFGESKGIDNAGLSTEEKLRTQRVITNFSEKLPENKSERRPYMLDTATSICAEDRKFEKSLEPGQIVQEGKDAKSAARRLSYASQIVNERFTDDVPVSDFKNVRSGVSDATKYVPLLGSYNRLAEASCTASEKRTDQSLRRFQVAAIMFGVDTTLVFTGGFYKPAFAGTRYIMNGASKVGLYRLRYVCGNRCWALAWSEVHWVLRGKMLMTLHSLAQYAATSNLNATEDDLRAVGRMQGVEQDKAIQISEKRLNESVQSGKNASSEVEDCLSNASDNPEKAKEKAEEEAGDFVSNVLGGKKEHEEKKRFKPL